MVTTEYPAVANFPTSKGCLRVIPYLVHCLYVEEVHELIAVDYTSFITYIWFLLTLSYSTCLGFAACDVRNVACWKYIIAEAFNSVIKSKCNLTYKIYFWLFCKIKLRWTYWLSWELEKEDILAVIEITFASLTLLATLPGNISLSMESVRTNRRFRIDICQVQCCVQDRVAVESVVV